MSIQSISFWQQDQNFWSQSHAQSQASSASAALINVMGQAEVNLSNGLSSIANATALDRTNNQITAIVQQVLESASGGSSSSTSGGSSSASSGSASSGSTASSSAGAPATGIGTVPLTTTTPLSTLGILPGGTIMIGTGPNTTTYTSTGTDTVADLMNAINLDLPTNANVTASLDSSGRLVITSRDKTSAIFISGSGTDAADIGFGLGHNTFLPKAPSSSASAGSSSSATSSSASTTSSSSGAGNAGTSSKSTTSALPSYLALGVQGVTTAAGILTADGVSGSLVDLLA